MWPFKASKRRTVRSLAEQVEKLTAELEAERKVNEGLQRGIILACDPRNTAAERVEEAIQRAAVDPDAPVIQMPDGEYVAPAAYDWERLAHDMLGAEEDEPGGASGSW